MDWKLQTVLNFIKSLHKILWIEFSFGLERAKDTLKIYIMLLLREKQF